MAIDALIPSEIQCKARDGIAEGKIRFLRGGAGTGKTTVIKLAIDKIAANGGRAIVYAPTHKAANVLRDEGVEDVYLYHTLIGINSHNAAHRKMIVDKSVTHLIFDEASMISYDKMLLIYAISKDYLKNKPFITFAGDWRQLPAIVSDYNSIGEKWFKNSGTADTTITLPINFRAVKDIVRSVVTEWDASLFDIIIVASNVSRQKFNIEMHIAKHGTKAYLRTRSAKGEAVLSLNVGDRLVAKFTDKKFQNNEIYKIKSVRCDRLNNFVLFEGKNAEIKIPKTQFLASNMLAKAKKTEEAKRRKAFKEGSEGKANQWDFAYAVTCHVAQGSGFDRVGIVVDDTLDYFEPFARHWFYTGITRSRLEVQVLDVSEQMAKRGFSFDPAEMFAEDHDFAQSAESVSEDGDAAQEQDEPVAASVVVTEVEAEAEVAPVTPVCEPEPIVAPTPKQEPEMSDEDLTYLAMFEEPKASIIPVTPSTPALSAKQRLHMAMGRGSHPTGLKDYQWMVNYFASGLGFRGEAASMITLAIEQGELFTGCGFYSFECIMSEEEAAYEWAAE